MSDRQAALRAGYSERVANHPAEKLWGRPALLRYLEQLVRHAAPPEYLVERLSERIDSANPWVSLRAIELAAEWAGYFASKARKLQTLQPSGPADDRRRNPHTARRAEPT